MNEPGQPFQASLSTKQISRLWHHKGAYYSISHPYLIILVMSQSNIKQVKVTRQILKGQVFDNSLETSVAFCLKF